MALLVQMESIQALKLFHDPSLLLPPDASLAGVVGKTSCGISSVSVQINSSESTIPFQLEDTRLVFFLGWVWAFTLLHTISHHSSTEAKLLTLSSASSLSLSSLLSFLSSLSLSSFLPLFFSSFFFFSSLSFFFFCLSSYSFFSFSVSAASSRSRFALTASSSIFGVQK